jgi:hypothetical protein
MPIDFIPDAPSAPQATSKVNFIPDEMLPQNGLVLKKNQTPLQVDTLGQRMAGAVPQGVASLIESQNQPLLPKDFDITRVFAPDIRQTPSYMKQQFTPSPHGDIAPQQDKLGRLLQTVAPSLFADYGTQVNPEQKGLVLRGGDAVASAIKNLNTQLVGMSAPTSLAVLPALLASGGGAPQVAVKAVVSAQMATATAHDLRTAFDTTKSSEERKDALQNAMFLGGGVAGMLGHDTTATPALDFGVRGVKSLVGPEVGPSAGGPINLRPVPQGMMPDQRMQLGAQLPERAQSLIDAKVEAAQRKLVQAQKLPSTAEHGFVAGGRGVAAQGDVAKVHDLTRPVAFIEDTKPQYLGKVDVGSKPPFIGGVKDVTGAEGITPVTREMQELGSGVRPRKDVLADLERVGKLMPQEKQELQLEREASAQDLRPALMVNGQPVLGAQGMTHADVLQKSMKEHGPSLELLQAFQDDASHVFVGKGGQVYDRLQAGKEIGYPGPLHSEALRAVQGKPGVGSPMIKLHSGVDWDEIKKTIGLKGDFMSQGAKIAMLDSGFKSSGTEVDAGQLKNRVMNKLGGESAEGRLWKALGIDEKFKAGEKTTPEQMAKWMTENGPQVKVESYGMGGKESEEKQEYDKMTHDWLEKLPHDVQRGIENAAPAESLIPHTMGEIDGVGLEPWQIKDNNETIANINKYRELKQKIANEPRDTSPRATSHYSSVSALPTDEPMPEWTATKSSKNVQRVDVVIPLPKDEPAAQQYSLTRKVPSKNTLWQPDNLHENLPNTLGWAMIQYKTGPKGEKIAVIAEAQSRWGQAMRERKQELANTPASESNSRALQQSAMGQDHPLLRDYNRLILKAAIEQAHKEGATHIMVSDAETAMMTEGHDNSITPRRVAEYGYEQKAQADAKAKENSNYEVRDADVNGEEGWAVYDMSTRPSQEPGMRLNYDSILPKITEELTGSKGERVSLGEHKNAYTPEKGNSGYAVYRNGQRVDNMTWPTHEDALEHAKQGETVQEIKIQRSNLIFRNPDGTPKTDVSGRLYPLDAISARLATGEPMTQMQKLYSGVPIEAMDKAADAVRKGALPLLNQTYQAPEESVIHTRPDGTTTKVNVDVKKHLDALKNVTSTPLEHRPDYSSHIGEKTPVAEQVALKANALMNSVSGFTHAVKPIDAIFDELGAGKGTYDGYLFKNFRGPVDDRFNTKVQLERVFIRPTLDFVKSKKLTPQNAERINVFANVQQEGGRARMLAMGVPEADINKIVNGITPDELRAYHMMRGSMEATTPELVRVIKAITGEDIKLVDNYWPMPRDYAKHVPIADEVITGTIDPHGTYDSQRSTYHPHGTADVVPGSAITRVPNAKTAIKLNAFETFQDHMEERAHLLAMGETLVKLGQIARSAEFKEKFGDHGQQIVLDWLNTVAAQGRVGKQVKALNIIRNNLAKSTIGMRLSSQFVHSANIALAVHRTGGIGNWWQGVSDMHTEKGRAFLAKNFAETTVRGSSEPTVAEASQGGKSGWVFAIEREIDRMNAQVTVLGAYRNELAKAGKDPEKYLDLPLDVQARNKALVLTRRAVASPLYKDTPPLIARGGSGTKMFTQYQNVMLDIWSNISHDLWTAGVEKVFQNKWGDKSAPAMQAVKMSIALGAMLLAASAVKYQFKRGVKEGTKLLGEAAGMKPVEEAPDSYWNEVGKEALRFPPLAGQLASAAEYKQTGIPLLDQSATMLHDAYSGVTGKNIPAQKRPSEWVHEKGLTKGLLEVLGFTRYGAGSGQYGDVIMGLLKQHHANETGRGLDTGAETGNENAPPKVVKGQNKKSHYTILK